MGHIILLCFLAIDDNVFHDRYQRRWTPDDQKYIDCHRYLLRTRAKTLKYEMEVRRDILRGVYASVTNELRGDSEAARKKASSLWRQLEKRYAVLYARMDAPAVVCLLTPCLLYLWAVISVRFVVLLRLETLARLRHLGDETASEIPPFVVIKGRGSDLKFPWYVHSLSYG
jgi:hypothetical protein